jgi:hypothetical protein
MRSLVSLAALVLLASCSAPADRPAETAAAAPTLSLADVAGTWTVQGMAEGSDSVIVTYTLTATATTEGWMITLPGRDAILLHVVPGGDSVVAHAGPYESVLRPGVMVTTEGTMRLVNGMLEGWTVARYATSSADSVVRIRTRGTRAN